MFVKVESCGYTGLEILWATFAEMEGNKLVDSEGQVLANKL